MMRAALQQAPQKPRGRRRQCVAGKSDEIGNGHAALLVHDLDGEGLPATQDQRQRLRWPDQGVIPNGRVARRPFEMTQQVVARVDGEIAVSLRPGAQEAVEECETGCLADRSCGGMDAVPAVSIAKPEIDLPRRILWCGPFLY